MKSSGACPKCACTKIYVVDEVRQPEHEYANRIVPLRVSTFAVPSSEVGLATGNEYRTEIGSFEAWICASCGLTEWYAKNVVEGFDRLLALGRKVHVRVVERAAGSPFR